MTEKPPARRRAAKKKAPNHAAGQRTVFSWFRNRRVRTKMMATVLIVIVAAGGVGWAGLAAVSTANAKAETMYHDNVIPLNELNAARASMLNAFGDLALLGVTSTASDRQAYALSVKSHLGELKANLEKYKAHGYGGDEKAAYLRFSETMLKLETVLQERLMPAALAGQTGEFMGVWSTYGSPLMKESLARMDKLIDLKSHQADVAVADMRSSYDRGRITIFAVIALGVAIALAVGILTARLIVRPLREVSSVLGSVADGDLTRRVTVRSRDEVGTMAESLNRATESMHRTVSALGDTSSSLAASAERLSDSSTRITATADETSNRAHVVAAASEQVSRNVQTVAAGSEELGASIREIAQNANDAAQVASEAVQVAENTNQTVSKLGDSSREIGNVVKVITSIAEQTNLLALNATIEAARAGDAGKGFAVVANEVKELAQETARATEDISQRVATIQGDTSNAVDAIGEIGRIIARINDYQVTIASAVEEQTATTSEINRNVSEAAIGSSEIATNIGTVAVAAQTTTEAVTESRVAYEELVRMSGEVRDLAARFRI